MMCVFCFSKDDIIIDNWESTHLKVCPVDSHCAQLPNILNLELASFAKSEMWVVREKEVKSFSCGPSFQSQHSAMWKPAGPTVWDTVSQGQQNRYYIFGFSNWKLPLAEIYTCLAWVFMEHCVSLNKHWRKELEGGRIYSAPCFRGFYQHIDSFASGPLGEAEHHAWSMRRTEQFPPSSREVR